MTPAQKYTIWLTGLSGAGKSTLATNLKGLFDQKQIPSCILDGDYLRAGLSKDLSFEIAARTENIRRAAEISKLLNENGIISIVSMISPLVEQRALAKTIIGESSFIEIYVATPLATCEARDPKGHYKSARAGGVKNFTGLSADYEPPINPDLKLNAAELSVDECLSLLLQQLRVKFSHDV